MSKLHKLQMQHWGVGTTSAPQLVEISPYLWADSALLCQHQLSAGCFAENLQL